MKRTFFIFNVQNITVSGNNTNNAQGDYSIWVNKMEGSNGIREGKGKSRNPLKYLLYVRIAMVIFKGEFMQLKIYNANPRETTTFFFFFYKKVMTCMLLNEVKQTYTMFT